MKKRLFSIVTGVCILGLCIVPAGAVVTSTYMYSEAATAGVWKTEPSAAIQYSASYGHVCGGDVGTYFYYNNVGLQSSFIKTTSRKAYIDLYEDDPVFDDCAKKYEASFATVNGYYSPTYFSTPYTNDASMENDGVAELFLKFKIETISGDTSTSIPAGLLYYRHWTV